MKARLMISVVLAAALPLPAGCLSGGSTRQTVHRAEPHPADEHDSVEDGTGDWNWVGQQFRRDQPRETDPDRWFKNYFQSEKAREIERNLGID